MLIRVYGMVMFESNGCIDGGVDILNFTGNLHSGMVVIGLLGLVEKVPILHMMKVMPIRMCSGKRKHIMSSLDICYKNFKLVLLVEILE